MPYSKVMSSAVGEIEKGSAEIAFRNEDVSSLSWRNVFVTVKDRVTKEPKKIVDGASGICMPGEICALMGPSGSGKTTLLNFLARRDPTGSRSSTEGRVLFGGAEQSLSVVRQISTFVEQEDALIGSLTAAETLRFVAKLALPGVSGEEIESRVHELIQSFGLSSAKDTLVGTAVRKGLSGGQKRRVSVASQLITAPKVIFLDEPTSGLDSTASYEVISVLKKAARRYNLLVVASIHQPSTKTFELFDKICLLSRGQTCYFGPTKHLPRYFAGVGFPVPQFTNPAEHILDVTNIDFSTRRQDSVLSENRLLEITNSWKVSTEASQIRNHISALQNDQHSADLYPRHTTSPFLAGLGATYILTHRGFLKSIRDVIAYGIRIAMYTGLAIMMGTVWLRLDTSQASIQPFINAIFFGSAFMSFMAVAYVPAFLEDRSAYIKERANGLYGPTPFVLANFLVGLPYLFLITLVFSTISYWLANFQPTAQAFFTWIMWIFLDLLAAESMVVFFASLLPNFVISLAVIAFANGLWMSVGGFLVSPTILNVFWRYVFHYIDYQAYVFQGMMVNEFQGRTYDCGEGCHCMYQSSLEKECKIDGLAVLEQYEYATGRTSKWVGILLAIVVVYRVLGWALLYVRKT